MVSSNSVTPSRAKYSACMGMSTVSAATSALRVSRSSAGGAVEHDELEFVAQRLQGVAQAILALIEGHELDVGAEQVLVRGDHAEVVDLG